MQTGDVRRISRRTALYDHAGEKLGDYDREKTRKLMTRPDVIVIGTRHRITGLRFAGPDAAGLLLSGSHHRRPAGTPHRHENYYIPAGVWHIDRIPSSWRKYFFSVVEGR
jgi:hypothetical protein